MFCQPTPPCLLASWAAAATRDDDEVWGVTVAGLPAVVRGVVNGLAPGGAPTDA